ncbi:hypothetical protein CO038_03530 [Candidatus Pacearchaeota archaeon CG_4_9_14_0_2_um_filter_39_13]|nr:AAA family ATPase [Candidatus Pacearchaeota archaeon]OIO43607.1 MAG: hypothetical protein AUJ64_02015 [Candidatus Pacearchaeota archaeon CG1_02_39_14]PJC44489.1 MAG: hypothetical protein CO038_03530 [Candidatus Pacearchaeota archaeon CG_4_9_14_0_2_um_filter_39_13]
MRLNKLSLKNIRSYKSETIVFPQGSTLLSGDIGSGKTTILLAIAFALFGLQPGQKGSSLLSNSEEEGKVDLELKVQDSIILIERTLKRTSKSVTQDYSAITIDGDKQELSVTELKAKLLSLLNYPPEFLKKTNILYNYTVYSPQEQMKQIILEDPESRLNVLRHVFGVDKYKKINENLSLVTARLREESRILQYDIRDLDESKTSLSSQKEFLNMLAEKIASKNAELQERIKERKNLEKEIHELENKVEEKRNFEKEIEKTKIALSYKSQEKARLGREIMEIESKIQQSPDFNPEDLRKVELEISRLHDRIESLSSQIIALAAKSSSLKSRQEEDLQKKERIFKIDICPTCLQDVSENHKHNILNETENSVSSTKKELEKIDFEIKQISEEMVSAKSSFSEMQSRKYNLELIKSKFVDLDTMKKNLGAIKKHRDDLEKDSELLEKHSTLLKNSVLEFAKYENLHNIKDSGLKVAFQKEKSAEIEIAEFKKEVELTQKEIAVLVKKISAKEDAKHKLSKLLEIEQWLSTKFSDLISFTEKNMMLKLRKEFSKFFNKWFSMLTTDAFYVNLDETFTPIVTHEDYELDYDFLSGGERTAVALAYRLALNQIINSLFSRINTQDLVILDEPTDGFSGQQLDKIRDILQELNIGQLIIVSHEPKIESFVDNVIRIKKENGQSKVA